MKQSRKNIFRIVFLLSLYVHCALRHKETRFAWISNVDSRKYQVGYKLQKLSRQVSVLLAGPEKNEFKALVKSQFLTAILGDLKNGLISLISNFFSSQFTFFVRYFFTYFWIWYESALFFLGQMSDKTVSRLSHRRFSQKPNEGICLFFHW